MPENIVTDTLSSGKVTHTTCPYCGVGCGVTVRQHGEQLLPVAGTETHPANGGRLCVKGSALHETLAPKRRLLFPEFVHPEQGGQRVAWDVALDSVAVRLRDTVEKHGPNSAALYLSGQLLTEDYYVANKLFKGFVGTANVDTNSRLCMSSAVAAQARAFGEDAVPACYEDVEMADLVILVGSNSAWAHPVLHQRLLKAKRERPQMKLVVIDPRRTESADQSDLYLPIAPGGDAFLFNGLLAYLADTAHIDKGYIAAHTSGFEAAIAVARQSSPDSLSVAESCGLDAAAVALFFNWFAATERTVTLFSQGINQSSSGTDKGNAIINCHLATGRVGKPGASPFSITGQPNAMGGREVGGLANMLAVHRGFDEQSIAQVGEFWRAPNMAREAGLKAVPLFEAIERGEIKFLWILATNPLVSMPEADRWRRALAKCETVIVSDCVRDTDTTQLASILLPAAGWGEKDGTVTNSERCISRQRAFLPAAGEAKPDWWALAEVGRRLGYADHFAYRNARDVFVEYAALSGINADAPLQFDISALATLDDDQYDALQPTQWPQPASVAQGSSRLFGDGRFSTPDRRARFIAVTPQWPQSSYAVAHPFVLNTGRVRDHWHTMTRTAESERLNRHRAEPYVEIHPDDAHAAGIAQDDIVELNNAHGSALLRARIDAGQQRGSLFAPMHWSDQFAARGRIDALVTANVDPISGQPELKHARVALQRVDIRWHGLLLSTERLSPRRDDYWAGVPVASGWVYWLAGSGDVQRIERELRACIPGEESLQFVDAEQHDRRHAWIEGDCLRAVLMLSTRAHGDAGGKCEKSSGLPEAWWLASKLGQNLSANDRRVLLTGHPPGEQADQGAMICTCFQVSENAIRGAIAAGACSAEQLGEKLRCGTNCGSCVPELNRLIRAVKSEGATEAIVRVG
jgi:assimilatory nitrate reductase catalytic subunit